MAGCTTRSTRPRRRKRSRRGHGGSRTGPTSPARLAPTARSARRSRKAEDRRRPATTSPGHRGGSRGSRLPNGPFPAVFSVLTGKPARSVRAPPDGPIASHRLLHRRADRGMGDARRAACRSAVLQPVRSPVWAAATATVERAEQQQYPDQPYPGQARQAPPGGVQSQPLPPPDGAAAAVDPLPGQRQPRGTPQPADTSPQPGDEVIPEPPSQKIANKSAMFSGLDKITGRIIAFDAGIGETVQFGALQVTPRVCYTRPPTETPNTDAFIEVDEVT